MGELILCRQPIAANPFYIETLSLNIYSLEELCYYVKNNSDLLDADFAGRELCHWIGRELDMKDLETELLALIGEEVPLHVFVEHVLSACGYLTVSEIRNVVSIIERYETYSDQERKKLRADKLLLKERIVDAIYAYQDLIEDKELPSALYGDISHNLGVCFARLFFFNEAKEYFEAAYKRNQKKVTLTALICSYICDGDEEGADKIIEKYRVPAAFAQSVIEHAKNAYQSDAIRDFDQHLSRLKSDHSRQEAYRKAVENIVDNWKIEYNRLCKI